MKTPNPFALILPFLIAGASCAQTIVVTIDGVYIERDSLSASVKDRAIEDGDIIAFDIPGFGDLLTQDRILLKDVVLLFNNIPLPEFTAYVENMESGVVRFEFFEDALTQENRKLLYNLKDGATKEIQLGIKAGNTSINYPPRANIFFEDVKYWSKIGWILIVAFLLFFLVIIIKYKSLVKDSLPFVDSGELTRNKATYSFGKTQMAFWTFIVISSFIYIWAFTTDLNSINDTALILLGISSITLAAGSVVNSQKEDKAVANNSEAALVESRLSEGSFFKDILSDANGISINRFQAFIFNIVFGVAFMKSVIYDYSMPEFDETQLLLLGLSNGTYVFLKNTEKK